MAKPYLHALSSVKKWGGKPEDYICLHNFLDCSKGAISDNRHRALTHNSWFLSNILERVFFPNSCPPDAEGKMCTIINSDGRHVSVRDVGEQHILEDFGMKFIPTAQDYLEGIEFKDWMNNGKGFPPSMRGIRPLNRKSEKKFLPFENKD